MFAHYLKIALRNLKKYKLQSIISITGLAVGFVCFTLSMIWIRYEMTYDSFHKDSNLIYRVRTKDPRRANGISPITSYALAEYLKNNFPEIQSACSVNKGWESDIRVNGEKTKLYFMRADSAFLNVFSIPLLSGNLSILTPESKKIAITSEAARKLFGNEDPIGKEIEQYGGKHTVEAIVQGWAKHSNLCFDAIGPIDQYKQLNAASCQTYIRLYEGVDGKSFVKKMDDYIIKTEETTIKGLVLTPITREHYDKPDKENNVKFRHITLFTVCAGLVILCSLFNFLTLFISRIQMRSKELALRKVNGASNGSLLSLLGTELVVTLLCTLPLGIIFIKGILPQFIELSGMQNREGGIYVEIFLYAGLIVFISYLLALVPIQYFRAKTLYKAIQGGNSGHNRNLFRKGSILIQLIVSIGFIFCTSVLIKQLFHFNHMDIGMDRKNIGTLCYIYTDVSAISQEMKQLSTVEEMITVNFGLFPQNGKMSRGVNDWDDMLPGAEPFEMETINGSPEFIRFYNFSFIKGGIPEENEDMNKCVVINEAAWKKFGWKDPIGKKYPNDQKVVGVIRDYYNESPTLPSHPVAIELVPSNSYKSTILFKYTEGRKDESLKQIKKMFDDKFPGVSFQFFDMETEYAKFMQSENYLLLLLGFVSVVCILVSIFGIYSLSSLTAEEKRKEIAVRKVNGASIREILLLFFKEYLLLLCIASAIAFPVGYLIMKSWIENYVKQTDINAWLYIAIFLLTGMIILCSVFSCVWKAAKINPAEIIKSE